ncbi:unnamed protein product [Nezara viridula]|uniref:Uncharacterized protein n=1 Tax=Nezara viridula TaxID=85310 RepID=A0A9P0HU80_NEZVI|nr:unnamed protein product [Nezara viridula]
MEDSSGRAFARTSSGHHGSPGFESEQEGTTFQWPSFQRTGPSPFLPLRIQGRQSQFLEPDCYPPFLPFPAVPEGLDNLSLPPLERPFAPPPPPGQATCQGPRPHVYTISWPSPPLQLDHQLYSGPYSSLYRGEEGGGCHGDEEGCQLLHPSLARSAELLQGPRVTDDLGWQFLSQDSHEKKKKRWTRDQEERDRARRGRWTPVGGLAVSTTALSMTSRLATSYRLSSW